VAAPFSLQEGSSEGALLYTSFPTSWQTSSTSWKIDGGFSDKLDEDSYRSTKVTSKHVRVDLVVGERGSFYSYQSYIICSLGTPLRPSFHNMMLTPSIWRGATKNEVNVSATESAVRLEACGVEWKGSFVSPNVCIKALCSQSTGFQGVDHTKRPLHRTAV